VADRRISTPSGRPDHSAVAGRACGDDGRAKLKLGLHESYEPARQRALLGTAEAIVDLAVPVDVRRDHVRGPADALVTIVEYGDFECPYCGQAEPVVRELLAAFGDVRYVWRHLLLSNAHPHAQLVAEACEAAARQGAFWPMHDLLLARQHALTAPDLRETSSAQAWAARAAPRQEDLLW
jgi:protein-disulfide isomerase